MGKNSQILLSIVVIAYNVGKRLSKCIDSIIWWQGDDFEVILVDDASMDNCGKICDDYRKLDSRIRVIHHNENKGTSVARNTGIDNAAGKWVVFVDGDDTLTADAIEIMRKYANIEADMILFKNNTMDRYGRVYGFQSLYGDGYINTAKELYKYKLNILKHRNNEMYSDFNCCSVWGKMWRRSFLNKYNLRFCKGIQRGEDMLFNFLCSHYFSCIYAAQKSVYNYVYNSSSIMNRCDCNVAAMYNSLYIAIMNIINENDETKDKKVMDTLYFKLIYHLKNCIKIWIYYKDSGYKKQERIELLKELCSYEWVQFAADGLKNPDNVKTFDDKIIKAISDKNYTELDRLGCKIKFNEIIKNSKIYSIIRGKVLGSGVILLYLKVRRKASKLN